MPQKASFLAKAWPVTAVFAVLHHICAFEDVNFVFHDLASHDFLGMTTAVCLD